MMMRFPLSGFITPLLGMVLLVTAGRPAAAQIRGRSVASPDSRWVFSGGVSAAVITDINDGATGTTWKFGSDPLFLLRGTVEKALDEATTIGVAASYGKIDLTVVPFAVAQSTPALPANCAQNCAAQSDMWQAMAQFRSGGGPGFHTFFEGNGGVTTFRRLRTRVDQVAIGKPTGALDLSGTLGGGFGYTLSQKLAVTLVQDFGIGFHSKTNLADGVSRTWRIRNTRAQLRFTF